RESLTKIGNGVLHLHQTAPTPFPDASHNCSLQMFKSLFCCYTPLKSILRSQISQWFGNFAIVCNELPIVPCQSKKSTQTLHISRSWPLQHTTHLSRIDRHPSIRDHMA
ncbi:hypothetical protein A2U01_0047002, partial [Trifolium medium]|nr:hypothetical protein [Trifolium medium]